MSAADFVSAICHALNRTHGEDSLHRLRHNVGHANALEPFSSMFSHLAPGWHCLGLSDWDCFQQPATCHRTYDLWGLAMHRGCFPSSLAACAVRAVCDTLARSRKRGHRGGHAALEAAGSRRCCECMLGGPRHATAFSLRMKYPCSLLKCLMLKRAPEALEALLRACAACLIGAVSLSCSCLGRGCFCPLSIWLASSVCVLLLAPCSEGCEVHSSRRRSPF